MLVDFISHSIYVKLSTI